MDASLGGLDARLCAVRGRGCILRGAGQDGRKFGRVGCKIVRRQGPRLHFKKGKQKYKLVVAHHLAARTPISERPETRLFRLGGCNRVGLSAGLSVGLSVGRLGGAGSKNTNSWAHLILPRGHLFSRDRKHDCLGWVAVIG